MDLAAWHRS